jgi:hypothetical protein
VGDVRRADEADRADRRVVEDRVDHLLVAVDDLQDAFGQPGSSISSASRTGPRDRARSA